MLNRKFSFGVTISDSGVGTIRRELFMRNMSGTIAMSVTEVDVVFAASPSENVKGRNDCVCG